MLGGTNMQDHTYCVALFAASITALGAVVAYFNVKLLLVRKNSKKSK